jgi:hypothetical protein
MIYKLKGRKLLSINRSNEVAPKALDNSVLYDKVFKGREDTNPTIRAREEDVIENIKNK